MCVPLPLGICTTAEFSPALSTLLPLCLSSQPLPGTFLLCFVHCQVAGTLSYTIGTRYLNESEAEGEGLLRFGARFSPTSPC